MPRKYIPTIKHKPHNDLGRRVGQYHRKHSKKFDKPKPERWTQPPYTPLPRAEDYDVAIAWGWILSEGVE